VAFWGEYTCYFMANRPRRSGATQTFAVPDEDDIYDDSPASIALLKEESEPVEDTNSPSFPDNDINETLAAFFYDVNSNSNSNSIPIVESQSTAPPIPAPRPITPATLTGTQFLKRKRQSSTPQRGVGQKDKTVWKHSRQRLPYEPIKDDHGHEIFYCAGDNCKWKGSSGNATALSGRSPAPLRHAAKKVCMISELLIMVLDSIYRRLCLTISPFFTASAPGARGKSEAQFMRMLPQGG
jgi:hypothetical protein